MPGLCGLLNHSRERSLRLGTPVRGLFMVSPAAHTPFYCASLCVVLIQVRCLHHRRHFAKFSEGRARRLKLTPIKTFRTYDFDPTTSSKKSDKSLVNNSKIAAPSARYELGGSVCRRYR